MLISRSQKGFSVNTQVIGFSCKFLFRISGGDGDWRKSVSERESFTLKKSKTGSTNYKSINFSYSSNFSSCFLVICFSFSHLKGKIQFFMSFPFILSYLYILFQKDHPRGSQRFIADQISSLTLLVKSLMFRSTGTGDSGDKNSEREKESFSVSGICSIGDFFRLLYGQVICGYVECRWKITSQLSELG